MSDMVCGSLLVIVRVNKVLYWFCNNLIKETITLSFFHDCVTLIDLVKCGVNMSRHLISNKSLLMKVPVQYDS